MAVPSLLACGPVPSTAASLMRARRIVSSSSALLGRAAPGWHPRRLPRCSPRRHLAGPGLPGRLRNPLSHNNKKNQQSLKRRQLEGDTWEDQGPIPTFLYQRHRNTLLQPPQFSGRQAWAGLGGLTTVNVLVYALWNYHPSDSPSQHRTTEESSVSYPPSPRHNDDWETFLYQNCTTNWTNLQQGRPWTLLTACISHQDAVHLMGNMVALWVFGFPTYRVLGTTAFGSLYALGGLACSVTHVGHNVWLGRTDPPLTAVEREWIETKAPPRNDSDDNDDTEAPGLPAWITERLATADRPSLGASGSVLAIAAVAAALFPLDKVHPNPWRGGSQQTVTIPLPSAVLLYALSDLLGVTQPTTTAGSSSSSVDHMGHLGGLVLGMLYVTTAWYAKVGAFRFLHTHPTGGDLPLLFRIRQWRQGNNPWKQ